MSAWATLLGIVLPLPAETQQGVQYGLGGVEFTGTLTGGGGGPTAEQIAAELERPGGSLDNLENAVATLGATSPAFGATATTLADLVLIRGDRHNGTDAIKLTFPTLGTYSSEAAQMMIFEPGEPVPLVTGTGTADGQLVTIDDLELELAETLFSGNPLTAKLTFSVLVGTKETVRHGRCIVHFRPDID